MGIRVSCCLSAYIDKLCFYLPKLTGMHVTFGSFPVETCEMCVAVYLPNLICVSDHYTFGVSKEDWWHALNSVVQVQCQILWTFIIVYDFS